MPQRRLVGFYTTDRYEGAAFDNGTRIVKQNTEPGDSTPDGMGGVVIGSVGRPGLGVAYFVEWDNRPGVAVGVKEVRVRAEKVN